MAARRIADHRYKDHERQQATSKTNAQIELATQYRNLLVGDSESSIHYGRYVKLLPALLECQSAHLLFVLDKPVKEIVSYGSHEVKDIVVGAMCDILEKRSSAVPSNVLDGNDATLVNNAISYISHPIVISGTQLCLLIAADRQARRWSAENMEQLRDVAQMLVSNLEVTQERHAISIQRRMQRSLVQFVRGNMSTAEKEVDGPRGAHRTGSLYSDLDEDLEADDEDDETDQVETSRMNVMFDFSARLIRRTLKVSGCVLVNIENLTELENIEADFPARSTIMGACFLKHLRTVDWHEKRSNGSKGSVSTYSSEAVSAELQTTKVHRDDTFDARGLSAPWLKQFLQAHPRAISFTESDLPEALRTLLPAGLQSCLLSPIYDSNAKAFALIIVFDDKPGDFTKADAHYVEAFGSSIYAEVLNQSLQKANDAKSLFISKISHEFRTPLHGVLASAEFLNDMAETTPAQLDFVQTIDTCGRTLLDIINHVLDYSKLALSKDVLAVEAGPAPIAYEDFDIVEVAEKVLSTAFSSYEFKRINEHIDVQKTNSQQSRSESDSGSMWEALGRNLEVLVSAPYRPQGYMVNSDLGAFRRIVLNLLGNALKYTHSGHVTLQLVLNATDSDGLEDLEITVSDTGIGIANTFLIEMFQPFTQECDFSAGTGLGLSIVKELVRKLHGKIDVKSKKSKGSKFTVSYPVVLGKAQITLFPGAGLRRDLENIKFHYLKAEDAEGHSSSSTELAATELLSTSTVAHLKDWYGMKEVAIEDAFVLVTDDNGYTRNRDTVMDFSGPVLTLCSTTAKYEKTKKRHSLALQVFVTKPCGPLKLGLSITECLTKAQNLARMNVHLSQMRPPAIDSICDDLTLRDSCQASPPPSVSSTVRPGDLNRTSSNITGGSRRTIKEEQDEQSLAELYSMMTMNKLTKQLEKSETEVKTTAIQEHGSLISGEKSHDRHMSPINESPSLTTDDPASSPVLLQSTGLSSTTSLTSCVSTGQKKHCLIVEDNPVNMMLLVAFAKQRSITVTTAVNGALAVQRVKDRQQNFDAILMDINMPVMNGFQSIEAIRKYERTTNRDRCKIVALTGLSTHEDRTLAKDVGADEFFTKPVKMRALGDLFVDWGIIETAAKSPNTSAAAVTG